MVSCSWRNCNREAYYSQALERVPDRPWGHLGGEGRVQTERQDLGHMPSLESMGGGLWGPKLRPDLSIVTKRASFGKLHWGLIKGAHQGKVLLAGGEDG